MKRQHDLMIWQFGLMLLWMEQGLFVYSAYMLWKEGGYFEDIAMNLLIAIATLAFFAISLHTFRDAVDLEEMLMKMDIEW